MLSDFKFSGLSPELMGKVTIRSLAFGVATVLIGLVLVGFSGRFFAPGDVAAIIRPQAGLILLPIATLLWITKARLFSLLSLSLAALALGSVAPGFLASGKGCEGGCIMLYQKNLLSKAWPRRPLAAEIIASGAQIVTLQEVSDHNRQFMSNMFDHYPDSVSCKFRPAADVAVLTSLTVIDGSAFCLAGAGLAGMQVETPDGRLMWILSVHLEWPFPFDQYRQSQLIAERIADLDGPFLIAGDFNMVPWGGSLRRIEEAAGNHRLGGFRNTFRLGNFLLPLPIDTVLVPEGIEGNVELRPYMGSDHFGVLARISLR